MRDGQHKCQEGAVINDKILQGHIGERDMSKVCLQTEGVSVRVEAAKQVMDVEFLL